MLIAGAGNSGAEIGLELARSGHRIVMSGRDTGHIPFSIHGFLGRNLLGPLVLRVLFHRIFTLSTPIGRKIRAQRHRAWRAADPGQAQATSPPQASSASAGSRR